MSDGHICNGVIPHPFLPKLASYGIDSDVKIWMEETDMEEDEEGSDEDGKSRRMSETGISERWTSIRKPATKEVTTTRLIKTPFILFLL